MDSQINWDREQDHITCSSQNTVDIEQERIFCLRKGYKCEKIYSKFGIFAPPCHIVNKSYFSSMVVDDVGKMSMVH